MLCAGLPAAAQEAPRFAVPGALRTLPAHGKDLSRGVPVKLQAVLSSWRMQPLLQHYADAFLAAGLYLPPVATQPKYLREPQLTALDVDRSVSYTVIFQPHPDGTTTVIYGEARLAERVPPDVGLPVFPGARGVIQSRGEGGRLVSYVVPAGAAEVADYYRSTLEAAGWTAQTGGTWTRQGAQLSVKAQTSAQGLVVRLLELPPSETAAPPGP